MARGADVVIDALDRFGVEYVFGHPGGAALPIFDALLNSYQIKCKQTSKLNPFGTMFVPNSNRTSNLEHTQYQLIRNFDKLQLLSAVSYFF